MTGITTTPPAAATVLTTPSRHRGAQHREPRTATS
jgi:hypothetical protein